MAKIYSYVIEKDGRYAAQPLEFPGDTRWVEDVDETLIWDARSPWDAQELLHRIGEGEIALVERNDPLAE